LNINELKIDHFKGVVLLVIVAVLWSSGGLLIKFVDWNPLAIAGARSAIAAVVIRAAFYRTALTWDYPQLAGAVAYAATVMMFVSATKLTTAANAILLQYTSPIWVALLGAWFLKEKTTVQDLVTIVLVFGGMFLFFMEKVSAGGLAGNILAVTSGLTMAILAVAMRKQRHGSPYGSVFLGNVLTFIIGLPFMVGTSPGISGWIALAVLGLFQLGISYVLYSIAIKHVNALEATIITMIEPILNPVWVFLAMGEAPGVWALAGGALILTAIVSRYAWPAINSRQ
jgi:drug/metabolite transporter (DMT)-like permease